MGLNNMKTIKLSYLFCLMCLTFIVQAGNIDLSLAIDLQLPEEVDYLQEADFSITVTNNSSVLSGGNNDEFPISVISTSFYIPNQLPFFFIIKDTSINQSCFFINSFGSPLPGGLPSIGYFFNFPPIPANSSLTCYGKLKIGLKSGLKKLKFNLLNTRDTDDDLSNNIVEFTFRIKPRPIPALSGLSLLLLGVLIISFVWIKYRYSLK